MAGGLWVSSSCPEQRGVRPWWPQDRKQPLWWQMAALLKLARVEEPLGYRFWLSGPGVGLGLWGLSQASQVIVGVLSFRSLGDSSRIF